MLEATTITQKWQMTLPKSIRLILGLKEPGAVLVEVVDEDKKLIRIRQKPSFIKMAGSLPPKNKHGKRLDILKIREVMEEKYRRE